MEILIIWFVAFIHAWQPSMHFEWKLKLKKTDNRSSVSQSESQLFMKSACVIIFYKF
jgi:hypothetical protein